MKTLRPVLIVLAVLIIIAGGGYYAWLQNQDTLPDYIASGNGRIEAEEIHVATKYAGRVSQVLVDEGDMVQAGDVLAKMDTSELDAQLAQAMAEQARAQEAVPEARAEIVQRESELRLARQQLERAQKLVKNNNISREQVDQREADRDVAVARLEAARARQTSAERSVEAAGAEVARIQVQVNDSVLTAPRAGRVQYRLAEPGEVLAAGGKVVTILDLTDVYMTVFLPTSQAGLAYVGNEARIVLDAAAKFVIPATVSFVADNAQFTPREVETRTEREKLMFRVKVRISSDLLEANIEKVKTGLPGEAYIMLASNSGWPEQLHVHLPTGQGSDATTGETGK
ncbi:HlyD family secretion protein [Thalassospira sp. TSL5-1]|uniref:HlyD family secretion protein n=1 Tax=Thalassospira sp. TSL5-1 TaxID=1544451 RepID=UPI00093E7544|nr:HlyD family efflux transporter periplasmic adaptor subunit [Thalassospira sp. TSL5-1]OKH89543.1 hemolysin secretion protein D [Thalassospira sp. TSL5-1]